MERHKMITEGAVPLCGRLKLASEDKNVVCVISGGNIDISTTAIINRALLRGRQFCFTVNLPDKRANIECGEDLEIGQHHQTGHNQSKVMDRLNGQRNNRETNGRPCPSDTEQRRHGFEIIKSIDRP